MNQMRKIDTDSFFKDIIEGLINRMRNRWINIKTFTTIEEFNSNVNCCFINNVIEKSTVIDIDIGQVDVFNFNMSYEDKFQMYTKSISL